jgi:hypothetical protein
VNYENLKPTTFDKLEIGDVFIPYPIENENELMYEGGLKAMVKVNDTAAMQGHWYYPQLPDNEVLMLAWIPSPKYLKDCKEDYLSVYKGITGNE